MGAGVTCPGAPPEVVALLHKLGEQLGARRLLALLRRGLAAGGLGVHRRCLRADAVDQDGAAAAADRSSLSDLVILRRRRAVLGSGPRRRGVERGHHKGRQHHRAPRGCPTDPLARHLGGSQEEHCRGVRISARSLGRRLRMCSRREDWITIDYHRLLASMFQVKSANRNVTVTATSHRHVG